MKQLLCFLLLFTTNVFSLDIFFSSDNHGALYPCNCPRNPAGGLAKRAFLFDSLRVNGAENQLFINGGGMLAGGQYDSYSNSIFEEDSLKSEYILYSVDEMGYDAVGISNIELKYGIDFLKKVKLPYVSANLYSDSLLTKRVFDRVIFKQKSNKKIAITSVLNFKQSDKADFYVSQPISELKSVYSSVIDSVDLFVIINNMGQDSLDAISKLIDKKNRQKTLILNCFHKKGRAQAYNIKRIAVLNFDYIVKAIHQIEFGKDNKFNLKGSTNLGLKISENTRVKQILERYEKIRIKLLNGKYGKLNMDLFVMYDCPYCQLALKQILPFVKSNKEKIDFKLFFVMGADSVEKRAKSGDIETIENLYQISLQAIDKDEYFRFLELKYLKNMEFNNIMDSIRISKASVDSFTNSPKGRSKLRQNFLGVRKHGVYSSPTLITNGEKYEGLTTLNSVLKDVCQYYNLKECKDVQECYVDGDCNRIGYIGKCQISTQKSSCVYKRDQKFDFYVIYDDSAFYKYDTTVVEETKGVFSSVNVKYLDYRSKKAKAICDSLKFDVLPQYIADKRIEKASKFEELKSFFILEKGFYKLSKVDYDRMILLKREFKEGVEVFVSPHAPQLAQDTVFSVLVQLLNMKKINSLKFITLNEGSTAIGGNFELETIERMLVAQKMGIKKYSNYIKYWQNQANSSYWEVPLEKAKIKPKKVKKLVKSKEIQNQLKESAKIWDIVKPDYYLYILKDNREVYKIQAEKLLHLLEKF